MWFICETQVNQHDSKSLEKDREMHREMSQNSLIIMWHLVYLAVKGCRGKVILYCSCPQPLGHELAGTEPKSPQSSRNACTHAGTHPFPPALHGAFPDLRTGREYLRWKQQEGGGCTGKRLPLLAGLRMPEKKHLQAMEGIKVGGHCYIGLIGQKMGSRM